MAKKTIKDALTKHRAEPAGLPVSEARRNGRFLRLNFKGDEPSLTRIEFRFNSNWKSSFFERGSETNPLNWHKVGPAISLCLLGYVDWHSSGKRGPFLFGAETSDASLAKQLSMAVYQTRHPLHNLFFGENPETENDEPVVTHLVFPSVGGVSKSGWKSTPLMTISERFLPSDCIEIFWNRSGQDRLTKSGDLQELANRIRKSLGLSGGSRHKPPLDDSDNANIQATENESKNTEREARVAISSWVGRICDKFEVPGRPKFRIFPDATPGKPHPLFQVISLLQEVQPAALPHESEMMDEQGAMQGEALVDCTIGLTRPVQLAEEISEGQSGSEQSQISVEMLFRNFAGVFPEAKGNVPRFIILAPPAAGKSSLLNFLAVRASRQELELVGRPLIPARIDFQDWERWAENGSTDSKNSSLSLPEYLARKLTPDSQDSPPWRKWLKAGEVLLLLDGLDEIKPNSVLREHIFSTLSEFEGCPVVLTCRSIAFEQYQEMCPHLPILKMAGLSQKQRGDFVRAYFGTQTFPAFDRANAEALIKQLEKSAQMQSLTTNPLFLGMMCALWNARNVKDLPSRRSELFEAVLLKMLRRSASDVPQYTAMAWTEPEWKLRLLAEAALTLYVEGANWVSIGAEELRSALEKSAKRDHKSLNAPVMFSDLFRNEIVKSGILQGSPESPMPRFSFVHSHFFEYLVARAIAGRLQEESGNLWETVLDTKPPVSIRYLLNSWAWQPRCTEIFKHLAGLLKNPMPLLNLLGNKKEDDLFRHRTCLAAECLAEIESSIEEEQGSDDEKRLSTPQRIAKDVLLLFQLRSRWFRVQNPPAHLVRALAALGTSSSFSQIAAMAFGDSRIKYRLLGDFDILGEDGEGHLIGHRVVPFLEAIAWMPVVIAPNKLAPAILRWLKSDSPRIRGAAASALSRFPQFFSNHPESISKLIGALDDSDVVVRLRVVAALGVLLPMTSDQAAVVRRLRAIIQDDPKVRQAAVEALANLGESGDVSVLEDLTTILLDQREEMAVRIAAAKAMGRMPIAVCSNDAALKALSPWTRSDNEYDLRKETWRSWSIVEDAAQSHPKFTPPNLDLFVQLRSNVLDLRHHAWVYLLLMRRQLAKLEQTIPHLIALIRETTFAGQRAGRLFIVQKFLEAGAPSNLMIEALHKAANEEDGDVALQAAHCLALVHPRVEWGQQIAPIFVRCLDGNTKVSALHALGEMGDTTADNPDILLRILACFDDPELRFHVGCALRRVPRAIKRPELIQKLAEKLRLPLGPREAKENPVVFSAFKALRLIGTRALEQPEILEELLLQLRTGSKYRRFLVAHTLAHSEGAALTEDRLVKLLADLLSDSASEVRACAMKALRRIPREAARLPEVGAHLTATLNNSMETDWSRALAAETLEAISRFLHGGLGDIVLALLRCESKNSALSSAASGAVDTIMQSGWRISGPSSFFEITNLRFSAKAEEIWIRHTSTLSERALAGSSSVHEFNLLTLGKAKMHKGDLDGASADFTKAIEFDPGCADAYYNRAIVRTRRVDLEGAIADFAMAIRIKPEHATAYYKRGFLKAEKGDLDGALADYTNSIELKPNYADAYQSRGVVRVRKGDLDGALTDFAKVIELKPHDAGAYMNCSAVKARQGDLGGALAELTKAIEFKPDDASAFAKRAEIRLHNGDLDGALLDYNVAIKLKPENANAYTGRGAVKEARGDLDGAIADYTKALEFKRDDASAYFKRGNVKCAKGDLNGALVDFTKAIEFDSNYASAYCNRGSANNAKGELDAALADFTMAIEIEANDAGAYCNRGTVKYRKGDLEGALTDFNKAIGIDPGDANAYYKRAAAKKAMGDINGALEDFTKAITLKADDSGKWHTEIFGDV